MITSLTALFVLYWHFIAAYVAGGAIYAVVKWTFSLVKLRRLILEDDAKDPEKRTGRDWITRRVLGQLAYPPKVSEAKGKLFGWAAIWPINLLYTLFADVIRESWNFLYEKFGSALQSIATAILPK